MSAGLFFSTIADNAKSARSSSGIRRRRPMTPKRRSIHDVLSNPNATNEQRQFAADQLNKLYQLKPNESPFHKVLGLLNHVGGKLQGQAQATGQPVTPNTPLNAPGAPHPDATPDTPTGGHGLTPLDGSAGATDTSQPAATSAPESPMNPPPKGNLSPLNPDGTSPAAATQSPPQPSFDAGAGSGAPDASQAATASPTAAPPTTNLTGNGADTLHPGSLPPLAAPSAAPPSNPSLIHRAASAVGKGLSTLTGGVDSALTSTLTPQNLPNTVPINASELPLPGPPARKFDPHTLTKGADLPEGSIDYLGNLVDPARQYMRALDPKGNVTLEGRRYSVQPFTPKPSTMAPRSIGTQMDIATARASEAAGVPILAPDGSQYDWDKLSQIPGLQLQAIGKPGGDPNDIRYILGQQKPVERTFGNEKYLTYTFDQLDPSKYKAMGVARTPSTSMRQVGVDANNQPVFGPQPTTPATPGMQPAPAPISVPSPAAPAPKSKPKASLTGLTAPTGLHPLSPGQQMQDVNTPPTGNAPVTNSHTASSAPATHFAPTSTTEPTAVHGKNGLTTYQNVVPAGQATALRNRNTALNGTTTALERAITPNPATGQSYLDLFKPGNEQEREKVANFIRLNDSIVEGDYSDRAGDGDINALLSFTAGTPEMVAAAKNDALTKAYAPVKADPAAMRAVADYYNLIGQIGGMRKATGANASQWAFTNLKQEVPSPLLDSSYEGVQSKLRNLAAEVNSNAKPNLSARPFDMNLLNGGGVKVGQSVKLKNGQTITVKAVHPDGSFE